ncbi:MAG: hypothetical protein C5B60_05680, partial [Chloroflexi bacterium]
DAEQADITAEFGTWLNALRFPVQVLVQVRRLDLGPYVRRLQQAVITQVGALHDGGQAKRTVAERWAAVAADHVAFIEGLARTRLLLERHHCVLLTYGEDGRSPMAGAGRLARRLQQRRRYHQRSADDLLTWQRRSSAQQQLDLRVNELTRQFERMGLQVRRLEGVELATLYYGALTPERATRHPLPPDVVAGAVDSLADLLAPASVELTRDHLCLEGEYSRVLALTGYPRRVFNGWLARIIDEDMPLDVSLHIHPRDARAALRTLRRHLAQYEASAALDLRMGRLPDPERRIAVEDVTRLQERIERGTTKVFDFGLYLRLYASRQGGLPELEHRTEQVHGALDHLGMVARPSLWEQDLAFASILPEGRDALYRTRFFDTETIATAWPFSTSSISMAEGIMFGLVPANGSFVVLDPFSPRFENANQVVFGVSGGGKSYATKLQVIRSLMFGISSIIVDPENEYQRLCEELGGECIRLAPGGNQHINPFDLPGSTMRGGHRATTVAGWDQITAIPEARTLAQVDDSGAAGSAQVGEDEEKDVLAEKIQSLHAFFDLLLAERGKDGGGGTVSRAEMARLDRVISTAYEQAGITSDPRTHSRPAPLLADIYRALVSPAYRAEDTTGLAHRLHRYVDGSLSHMFSAPTDVELHNPLVVFNIADLDEELRPLGLYLVSDCMWTHVRREHLLVPRPRLLLVDEAWSLLQFPEGGRFLSRLVRRARKRFLGVVTISQDINDFLGSEWGQTILSNSATKLLMKQDSSSIDVISSTFKLTSGERRLLLCSEKGEGLLLALGARIAIRVEASPDEHRLATSDPRETRPWPRARELEPHLAAPSRSELVARAAPPPRTSKRPQQDPVSMPAGGEGTLRASTSIPASEDGSTSDRMSFPRPPCWVPAIPSAFAAMQAGNVPLSRAGADSSLPPDPLIYLPSRIFHRSPGSSARRTTTPPLLQDSDPGNVPDSPGGSAPARKKRRGTGA